MMFDFGINRVVQMWDGGWQVEMRLWKGRVWTFCWWPSSESELGYARGDLEEALAALSRLDEPR